VSVPKSVAHCSKCGRIQGRREACCFGCIWPMSIVNDGLVCVSDARGRGVAVASALRRAAQLRRGTRLGRQISWTYLRRPNTQKTHASVHARPHPRSRVPNRLCKLPGRSTPGSCRVCMVDVNGAHKAACCTPAVEGSFISTDTPSVR
jgi:hypothetical protein